jgi:quercetin dioxygenase-like cupin family protein
MVKSEIVRKAVLAAVLDPPKRTQHVEVKQIDFAPGQETGLHFHPCPVICYVVKGTAAVQVEGEPVQHITAGQAVLEPANKKMLRFDNASAAEPMTFIAFYLLDENEDELIRIL